MASGILCAQGTSRVGIEPLHPKVEYCEEWEYLHLRL